jgi:hypothetical protein
MDAQVQDFTVARVRRRPSVVETGGFVVGIDPADASPYVNYATPLPGSARGTRLHLPLPWALSSATPSAP